MQPLAEQIRPTCLEEVVGAAAFACTKPTAPPDY